MCWSFSLSDKMQTTHPQGQDMKKSLSVNTTSTLSPFLFLCLRRADSGKKSEDHLIWGVLLFSPLSDVLLSQKKGGKFSYISAVLSSMSQGSLRLRKQACFLVLGFCIGPQGTEVTFRKERKMSVMLERKPAAILLSMFAPIVKPHHE